MLKAKPGFPPIEAFVISVVLGIVGVTAFGQFQDLSTGRAHAAVPGPDEKTTSAAAINFAARILEPASAALSTGIVADCGDDYAASYRTAVFPSDYSEAAYQVNDAGTTCR
jgi:hypothetical protein